MNLQGTPRFLLKAILTFCPKAQQALENSAHIKSQLLPYQAAALYILARSHNGGNFLEIGTFVGYSASLMAQAAPDAQIITLNPAEHEVREARVNLKQWPNVEVIQTKSWDYLESYDGPFLDFIFVDGDHKRIEKDLPWWDWVAEGGLMLFHDYSPKECPPVYNAVSKFFKNSPDILLVDTEGIGMVGFVKGVAT